MSGYIQCACRDCLDIAIGVPGDLCLECEAAGCDILYCECQRPDAYCDYDNRDSGEDSP